MQQTRPETVAQIEPGIRRVLAPNPSPMTFQGTNSYILGQGAVAVVDPGPADADHLAAILGALQPGETVAAILVTHSHVDHSPLAAPLRDKTGAPVYAYGSSMSGRSDVMTRLAAKNLTGGGEGVDMGFAPDIALKDGARVRFGDNEATALWTPGHMANHLCFGFGDTVLTGDLVMGWASTMISPPDGDLGAFMASARRVADLGARRLFPGHGGPIEDPHARIQWLLTHRQQREEAVLAALAQGHTTVASITAAIYTDVAPALLGAAARNVLAHLVALFERGAIRAEPELSLSAEFFLAEV